LQNTKHQTPNTKHQTPNTKHQTPNTKHQTANSKQQTANSKQQTANSKQPIRKKQAAENDYQAGLKSHERQGRARSIDRLIWRDFADDAAPGLLEKMVRTQVGLPQ
jgi:hypothetical protein